MNLSAINASALNGSAFEVWLSGGAASVVLSPSARPVVADLGVAVVPVQISANAHGTVAQKSGADATIDVQASGTTYATKTDYGAATIAINGEGQLDAIVSSYGGAAINIMGSWGIPLVPNLTDAPAPQIRVVRADADERTINVPADGGLCIRERRTLNIQTEGRQA